MSVKIGSMWINEVAITKEGASYLAEISEVGTLEDGEKVYKLGVFGPWYTEDALRAKYTKITLEPRPESRVGRSLWKRFISHFGR